MLIRAIADMLSAGDREGLATMLSKISALEFLVLIDASTTVVHLVEVASGNTGNRPV